ncbi:hypothetical protein [Enterococcus faecium]|uniref:hypothetical protein n=1 Tax=Enterococcus faecium TaxID=1352 RepID=UPI001E2C25C8|nr:hypothetical protein [Enterococcus faecium]
MSLISGVNYKTGELNVPFVELDSIAQKQFSDREGDEKFIKYDDFLREVDKHFVNTMSLEDDQEYTIKLHTDVNPQTLRSAKSKTISIKKRLIRKSYFYRQRVLKIVLIHLLLNRFTIKSVA